MKVQQITSDNFKRYGSVLKGYDYTELFAELTKLDIPNNGITYSALVDTLENCKIKDEFKNRGFGGMPIQIGYVGGVNDELNCLEYHKSSEFNIALDNIILVLGCVTDIKNGKYDTGKCEAFFVPAGTGVELYSTTLHYAPFSCESHGYKVVCVLPNGTNQEALKIEIKTEEDKMCFGTNKWLMTHPDAAENNIGAYVGLKGNNIKFSDLILD